MKTQQVHIRLDGDELSFLDTLGEGIVSRQLAATILLKKAIRTVRNSGSPELFKSISPALAEAPVTYKIKKQKP